MQIIERIKKANDVIDYAIKNGISVKSASKLCGYSDTYVKNIKMDVYEASLANEIDESAYRSFVNKINEYHENKIKNTPKEKTKRFGDALIKSYKDAVAANKIKPPTPQISKPQDQVKFSSNGNEAEVEMNTRSNYTSDHIKTLDQLLEKANVDTDIWHVKDFLVNKWDVTLKEKDVAVTYENFQVKARLERLVEVLRFKQAAEIFKEMIENYQPPIFDVKGKLKYTNESNLLEINLCDLHFGKLTHKDETGENYDIKIASKRFLNAIETLLIRASGFGYEKILFVIGNDFFNSDTILNTTTAGTPQDEDLRWYKTFRGGIHLVVDGINLLKNTGVPIEVMVIAGNHDYERSFYMGEFLDAWFRNDTDVIIDNGPSPRKYYRHGLCLLGFTHGSEEKEGSLPMIMANDVESKKLWSETRYHEFHVGHWHRKKSTNYKNLQIDEDHGVTVRVLSSLTANDSWHNKHGFLGAIKAGEAFIWNSENGLIAQLNANLKE